MNYASEIIPQKQQAIASHLLNNCEFEDGTTYNIQQEGEQLVITFQDYVTDETTIITVTFDYENEYMTFEGQRNNHTFDVGQCNFSELF